MHFTIDKLFEHDNVTFIANGDEFFFNKSLSTINNKRIVKYKWQGVLTPHEVLVIETKFPMILDCGIVSVDLPIIIIGSIFILFLIIVLYIILSQVMKLEGEENF